jgi:diguanylate cyclase (GGDEF)-like protein
LLGLFIGHGKIPVIATLLAGGAYHCFAARTVLNGTTLRGLSAGLFADLLLLVVLFYLTGGMLSPLLAFASIWAIAAVLVLQGAWRWLYASVLAGAGAVTTPSLRLLYSPIDADDPGIVISGAMAVGTAAALAAFVLRRLRRMRDHLVRVSLHDPLTGLLNRRAFDQRIAELCGSGGVARPAFSIAIIDVDHFKALNDTKGHEAGDRALVQFAQVISSNLRPGDGAYRIGGEEFAIVFPATSAIDAEAATNRLRDIVRAKTDGPITFSAGVASGNQPTVVPLADQAMYEAKRAGRDNVQLSEAMRLRR